ncbi:ergothioneine biosynthesis protein EgtB [Falsibacillus pallidus]|uniref:ergothioneine biosynthesis protein EgtB n=1 Tax=Falsibacillus pallidus TaxID=493781 RepID=UPI003D9885FA
MSLQSSLNHKLGSRYHNIRSFTEKITAPLETEDYVVQAGPDVRPPKWHLLHTTWFYEKNILMEYVPRYSPYNEHFHSLFTHEGDHSGHLGGALSRPTVKEVISYRHHVDDQMMKLIEKLNPDEHRDINRLIEMGLQNEQKHQEQLLADIKYLFSMNPLAPSYMKEPEDFSESIPFQEPSMIEMEGGLVEFGFAGEGDAHEYEGVRQKVWLNPYVLSSHPVLNAEYLQFIEDGGYERPELWLADGWELVQREGWKAPLYWRGNGGDWQLYTMSGERKLEKYEPVCHISYFEADAYARWKGMRLPTEAEWENAFELVQREGNFAEKELYHPSWKDVSMQGPFNKAFGDVWEWTTSLYSPRPKSTHEAGLSLQEQPFSRSNQFVLKGGSCSTPSSLIRPSSRLVSEPSKRVQFSGFRLAKDL